MYNQGQNKDQKQQGQKQILSDDSSRGNVGQGSSGNFVGGQGQSGQGLGKDVGGQYGGQYGKDDVSHKAPSR